MCFCCSFYKMKKLEDFLYCNSLIHYERSTAPSKASSPHSAIYYFLFKVPVFCPFLKVIQQLLTSLSSSSRLFCISFNNGFRSEFALDVASPLSLLPCIASMIFHSSLILCNTSSFVTRSVQLIVSNLLQQHISGFSSHF